jgi:hypothetical protein
MPSCFLKRILPFTLALLGGVALWYLIDAKLQVLGDVFYLEYGPTSGTVERGTWASPRAPEGGRSKTWLIIRSMPEGATKIKERDCGDCSVRLRMRFGEDGKVSVNEFQLAPPSYSLVEDASAAARSIKFTPATKNGRPVAVWVAATYSCGRGYRGSHAPPVYRCSLALEKDSARAEGGEVWRVITSYE